MLTDAQADALKDAVATHGTPHLWPGQVDQFIEVLGWFIVGGPPNPADAFVTDVSVLNSESGDEFSVMWLRGNSIGLLTVLRPENDNDPPSVNGWVRPVSKIREIEIRSAKFNDDRTVEPIVRIHFNDDADVVVEVGGDRVGGKARDQAATFIKRIQATLVG